MIIALDVGIGVALFLLLCVWGAFTFLRDEIKQINQRVVEQSRTVETRYIPPSDLSSHVLRTIDTCLVDHNQRLKKLEAPVPATQVVDLSITVAAKERQA